MMSVSNKESSRLLQIKRQLVNSSKAEDDGGTPLARVSERRPLDNYRKQSTINNYLFKEIVFGRLCSLRDRFFDIMVSNPLFTHHTTLEESRDQVRHSSFKQMIQFYKDSKLTLEDYKKDPSQFYIAGDCFFAFDQAIAIKFAVHFSLYMKTIWNLGTAKHYYLVERAARVEDIGCFALTELGHGSNARDIRTTAHYDKENKEFIINTPDDLAMKFWIGAAANLANMTVCFAQLYSNGKHFGPHAFIVPIRNIKDHTLMPGVTIGDCGLKNGLNAIDNGFLVFKNVRIPLDNLLDRFSSISADGQFKAEIQNPDKRFGIQLGSLSGGRIGLASQTTTQLINALTIATRFAAVRRQFGLPGELERPILEYQLVQHRLIPKIASAVAIKIASQALIGTWEGHQDVIFDPKNPLLAEMHAHSTVLKAISTWNSDRGIQICREICGGLGYSAYNRLGALYSDNNINMTWEGDNYVVIQQAAKFLLDNYQKKKDGKEIVHKSLAFLRVESVAGDRCGAQTKEDFLKYSVLRDLLEYRTNLLIQNASSKLLENLSTYPDPFSAWNSSQVFFLVDAAKSFGELWILNENVSAEGKCNELPTKTVLDRLIKLWAISVVVEDLATFRENDYISSEQGKFLKTLVLELSSQLKNEVIGIIDALAPPDAILGSPIGASDGDIYNKFLKVVTTSPKCFERVAWWQEIHPSRSYVSH